MKNYDKENYEQMCFSVAAERTAYQIKTILAT